jgi:hypothetical protein
MASIRTPAMPPHRRLPGVNDPFPIQQLQPANHANLQLYNQVLGPNGQMQLDSGNFFFLLASASALPITFLAQYGGPTENMIGIPVGTQIYRVKSWNTLTLTGTPGAVIQFWHGYGFTRQDYTNFQAAFATVNTAAGTALAVVPGLGSAISPIDRADIVVAAGGNAVIAANPLRRSITIGSLSTNVPATTNLRLQGSDAIGGVELQPGTYYNEATTAALNVHNGDANAQTIWVQEYE